MTAQSLALGLLELYSRFISPLLPRACRFYPSCSEYSRQAILAHGPWRGSWLTAGRLLRCQPLSRGGFDPVPPAAGAAERMHHG